jgi:hypothetical protein
MLGIMVPTSARNSGRWQSSDRLTALHALAAVTFTKSLLHLGTRMHQFIAHPAFSLSLGISLEAGVCAIQDELFSSRGGVAMYMCTSTGNKNASSQLLTYFCSIAPEITTNYIEPSLLFLTNYYQDPMGTYISSH